MSIDIGLRAGLEGGSLVLSYAVRNNSGTDAYLLNRLYDPIAGEMTADIAYVIFDRKTGIVHVGKYLADLPRDRSPTAPVAPFVTPLRAGETFEETIRLMLPLRERIEYVPPPQPSDNIENFAGVQFTLGYYWSQPGVKEREGEAFGQPVIIPEGFTSNPQFGKVSSEVQQFPIAVDLGP